MQEKQCVACSSTYSRNKKFSIKQWQNQKYCSGECYAKSKKGVKTGRKMTPEQIAHRTALQRGGKRSEEFKKRLSDMYKGSGNPSWRGGISYERKRATQEETEAHRKWRTAIFERDNWTCRKCGVRGNRLNADHIKPYALFPELRTDIDNGQTLCTKCHGEKTSWELKKYWKNQHAQSDYWT